MPIYNFNKWAKIIVDNWAGSQATKSKLIFDTTRVQLQRDITNACIKAYELGKNPNVEKLDK